MFPVKSRDKLPLIRGWTDRASNQLAILEAWQREYPSCNWWLATGRPSNVFVLDVDGEEGRASVANLERQGFVLAATRTATAGRADGGEHRYYRMPQGIDVHNDQSGTIGSHIDVRGTHGFVVCPPSTHASGKQYRFIDVDAPIVDAPTWVIERLNSRHAVPGARTRQADAEVIGRGWRTPLFVSLAGKLRSQGIPAAGIEAALNGLNSTSARESARWWTT
jgi:putative DNA primase/helicase